MIKVVSYTVKGLSHKKRKKGCEDFVCLRYNEKHDTAAISLCDGIGSCKFAGKGADMASFYSSMYLANNFEDLYVCSDDEIAQKLMSHTINKLKAFAKKYSYSLDELSSTLLCAAMHTDGRSICFRVGDGALISYGEEIHVSQYEHKIAMNVTSCLTTHNPSYYVSKDRGVYAYFLTSDGAEPVFVNRGEITARCETAIRLGFSLPEKEMQKEFENLSNLLQQKGFTDDLSYGIIFNDSYSNMV